MGRVRTSQCRPAGTGKRVFGGFVSPAAAGYTIVVPTALRSGVASMGGIVEPAPADDQVGGFSIEPNFGDVLFWPERRSAVDQLTAALGQESRLWFSSKRPCRL